MRDFSKIELEAVRPNLVTASQAIDFVLERLYKDQTVSVTDEIAVNLTFEELIGALLLARDVIKGDGK